MVRLFLCLWYVPTPPPQVNAGAKGWELIGTCACWFCSNFYSTGLASFVPEILERAYNGDLNLVKDYRFVSSKKLK